MVMKQDAEALLRVIFGPRLDPKPGHAGRVHASQLRARVNRGDGMSANELALLCYYNLREAAGKTS